MVYTQRKMVDRYLDLCNTKDDILPGDRQLIMSYVNSYQSHPDTFFGDSWKWLSTKQRNFLMLGIDLFTLCFPSGSLGVSIRFFDPSSAPNSPKNVIRISSTLETYSEHIHG